MSKDYDVIVVGAGAAGLTAAIYLKRANLNVLVVDKSAPGGEMNMIAEVENYPGVLSVDGPTLAMTMFQQVTQLGADFKGTEVLSIEDQGDIKIVHTKKQDYTCAKVILATGRKARELGLENEKSLTGRGVSWCALCDGNFYRDKDIAVIGGGNSALGESLYLAKLVKSIKLIHRRDTFRADDYFIQQVLAEPKIEVVYNSQVTKFIEEDDKLCAIEVVDKIEDQTTTYDVSGCFIYVGYVPETKFVDNLAITNDAGYVVVDAHGETSVKGIYAAGDLVQKDVYQIVTATGEGANAAVHVIESLK